MESETIPISNTSLELKESSRSLSILVVDDDTTCLAIVAAILKKFRYEVVTVKNPKDALCVLRIKGRAAFDLVVSDVHMPDMNGFELQKIIAQEFNLPVVLMSADDEEGVALEGLQNGAAFFILKPVSADDLRDLWQYSSMYYNRNNEADHLIEENIPVDVINDVSASSVLGEDVNIKNDARKGEPAEDKRGETSDSSPNKKPKLVWTHALHDRFLEAIRSIGLDRAVPKKILEVMNVPGLTRENVASHLQKYRIFLRRVSETGYKIHSAAENGFDRSFLSILTSSQLKPPQILMLRNMVNNKYRNPGRFPGTNNGVFFPNQEASSSSSTTPGIEWPQMLSHSEHFLKPNLTNSSLLIQDTDLSCLGFPQSNNLAAASGLVEDLPGSLPVSSQASLLSSTGQFNIPGLSYEDPPCPDLSVLKNDAVSTSYKPYQTNYVGLRMSNLKQLTESSLSMTNQGAKPCSGMTTLPGSGFQGVGVILDTADQDFTNNDTTLDQLLESIGDSTCFEPVEIGGQQLSDVMADYQMLISPSSFGSLIGGTENAGEIQESVFSPHLVPLDHTMSSGHSVEEGGFRTSLTDEVHLQNQGEQNGGNNPINSLDFNASSQFNTTLLSASEREDQEFLESLLASDQFGAEQTALDGMYLNPYK